MTAAQGHDSSAASAVSAALETAPTARGAAARDLGLGPLLSLIGASESDRGTETVGPRWPAAPQLSCFHSDCPHLLPVSSCSSTSSGASRAHSRASPGHTFTHTGIVSCDRPCAHQQPHPYLTPTHCLLRLNSIGGRSPNVSCA